ncbi:hypothetical protein GDO78_018068 [Eleutherodactylus coqui]|uniref:Uncharacterized protein n=1 Tax=Eleutherodactylus coqui TaxID=57060 RepID=A0A8J6ECM9_ELECQ|nr:hypothetical protein GDO78_018068 [Eleutherodactylus coqui]
MSGNARGHRKCQITYHGCLCNTKHDTVAQMPRVTDNTGNMLCVQVMPRFTGNTGNMTRVQITSGFTGNTGNGACPGNATFYR